MESNDAMLREFLGQAMPQMLLFYRSAHAMTGERESAEEVLSAALYNCYVGGESGERGSLRPALFACLRESAMDYLEEQKAPSETDYAGLPEDPSLVDPMAEWVCRQPVDIQRILVLRYGCGCSGRQIAAMTGRSQEEVHSLLERGERSLSRKLKSENQPCRPFDTLMMRSLRRAMNRETGEAVDVGRILAAFEQEANGVKKPKHPVVRALRVVFGLAGALLLIGALWLLAVLLA